MMARDLTVFVAGVRAGTLTQDHAGARSFSYEPTYDGPPLSLSMPVGNQTYHTRVVDAYLLGLLPDDERVRREAGRRFGVSGNNPFALLSHMGLDCPGAVQFCPRGGEHVIQRHEELVPLSEEQIAQRLMPTSGSQADTWLRAEEHWSLGGNQSKFALRMVDGVWHECRGAAATTHILKPGIEGMRLEALDEFITMRIAQACGLPTEQVEYQEFCGVPAIVATRYDRVVTPDGVARIHQEDLCQALSVTPSKKYAEDGGPSTPDVLRVLWMTSRPEDSARAFAAMLFFNYLMGAPDAHAKNYSLLHLGAGTCVFAPLYDAASGLPYDLSGRRPLRMAMSIGGENRLGFVGREHIESFALLAGIEPGACVNLMANLCERIVANSARIVEEAAARGVFGVDELAERLLPRLESHCRQTLQRLE